MQTYQVAKPHLGGKYLPEFVMLYGAEEEKLGDRKES